MVVGCVKVLLLVHFSPVRVVVGGETQVSPHPLICKNVGSCAQINVFILTLKGYKTNDAARCIRLRDKVDPVVRGMWEMMQPVKGWAIGFVAGALLGVCHGTLETPIFSFSANGERHSIARMRMAYKDSVKHLKYRSDEALKEISKDLTEDQQRKILRRIIAQYLVPTSHDHVFGHDMVFYNEKERTTVLDYDEYNTIRDKWITVLEHFDVLECVDTFRMTDNPVPHSRVAERALTKCW